VPLSYAYSRKVLRPDPVGAFSFSVTTTRYRIFRLVYFEFFSDVRAAIAREKEIKGWRREKKIWLIKRNNPTWADLAEKLPHRYQMTDCPKQIPHPRSPKPCDRVRDDKLKNRGRAS
jgi:hypothetical protein